MVLFDKTAWRAALAIHSRLVQARAEPGSIELPVYYWLQLEKISRSVRRANAHKWRAARRQTLVQMLGAAEQLQRYLSYMLAEGQRQAADGPMPRVGDIYQEIVALRQEFSQVTIALDDQELVVTTEPIVLEGTPLGPFEIRLDYSSVDLGYRVVATDPRPADGREDVTHPHVQDESLCEGEGRAAIRSALTEGRLLDFFVLVTQILSTYARGRAYVELDHWESTSCSDCGSSICEDDRYTCERCDKLLCEACQVSCPQCGRTCCSACTAECKGCGQAHCRECLEDCPGCGEPICPSCHHEGYCEDCYEHKEDPDDPPPLEGTAGEPAASETMEVQGCT